MEQKKTTIWHALICVVLVCLIWGGYFVARGKIDKDLKEDEVRGLKVELDRDVLSQIEQVSVKDGALLIEGWALRRDSKNQSTYIVLKSSETEEDIVIQANCTERTDVDSIVEDGYDFGKTGFSAKLKDEELRSDVSYEILIVLEYEGEDNQVQQKKITTNRYIYSGELYRYRPEEFVKPEIEETEIREVIDNGSLYGYDMEKGGWTYECKGTMYWILDGKQFEGLNSTPSVPVLIYPLHGEQIPEDRTEQYMERGYDYYEIYLNDSHRFVNGEKTYYVVSLELPEYLFAYVRAGSYGNGGTDWIYKEEFQMDLME